MALLLEGVQEKRLPLSLLVHDTPAGITMIIIYLLVIPTVFVLLGIMGLTTVISMFTLAAKVELLLVTS